MRSLRFVFCRALFILFIVGSGLRVHAASSELKPLIVLVPGFFNSLSTQPDFAKVITATIEARGYTVETANTLSSIGTVEENGRRLEAYLRETVRKYPDRSLVLFAHSAGGLYALQALTINPALPVKTLVSLATPWHGVEFVDRIQAGLPAIDALFGYLKLDGMRQFASGHLEPVIAAMKVPDDLRVISLAARQESCLPVSCANAKKLSWLLSIAQKFMASPSDGVVTVGSALGEDVKLKRLGGERLEIEHWDDFTIPLDHWEVVQEAALFHVLGVVNTEYISRTQTCLFNTIVDRLFPKRVLGRAIDDNLRRERL